MSASQDITDAQIRKFKQGLLMKLAACEDPRRLMQVAMALDDEAHQMVMDRLEQEQVSND